jgi:SAM-dependent methyltransferase
MMSQLVRCLALTAAVALVAAPHTAAGKNGTPQTKMFSESDAYERFMGRWSRQLAAPFVRFAGVRDGESLLDVGCGTGSVAGAALSLAPAASITGIDLSAEYVARARASIPGARFEVADAQALPFAGRTFDRALSLLVINFVPAPAKALGEMIRVTRPGGTVAAAVWDYGEGMEMLRVFWDEAVALDPAADTRDERRMPLCRRGELAALWRDHGLADVVEEPIVVRLAFSSFDDYWEPFLAKQGPAGVYVASLAGARKGQLRERLRRRLVGAGADGGFTLGARAWAVRGRS